MATDFFQRQDNARRQTRLLLFLLVVGIAALILVLYLAAVFIISAQGERTPGSQVHLWDPGLFLAVTVLTLVVVGIGSLMKVAELRGGGAAIAESLGGRLVSPNSQDLRERRLLNVVEEMAIASGVPVPPVYIMDEEAAINAFAAGYAPDAAVVAVTRGTLERLNREELQGVIAHEFSHILNGDMRVNIRLIGLVAGLLALTSTGYILMRAAGSSGGGNRDDRDKGGAGAIVLAGLALIVVGWAGVLVSRLIKAAISRQREFLADASAVQFTRNPTGIANALKKIGGFEEGSRIRSANAEDASHMFFGEGISEWLATHPPLIERIRRLDPNFRGEYPEVPVVPADDRNARDRSPASVRSLDAELSSPTTSRLSDRTGPLPIEAVTPDRFVDRVGRMTEEHVTGASRWRDTLPDELWEAARDPFDARALVFAVLLDEEDPEVRGRQLEAIEWRLGRQLRAKVEQLEPTVREVPAPFYAPLLDLTRPSLSHMTASQFRDFRNALKDVVMADERVTLLEYFASRSLIRELERGFGYRKPVPVRYTTAAQVAGPARQLLSSLSQLAGSRSAEAYANGGRRLALNVPPDPNATLDEAHRALAELEAATPQVKKEVLAACVASVLYDNQVTRGEAEMLRSIAAALDCPTPPFLDAELRGGGGLETPTT